MPFADFGLVFSDPEIGAEFFTVLRSASGDDSHGRSNPTVVKTFPNEADGSDQPYGIITWASPNDLVVLPDQEHQQKTISIDTPFRLQGPLPGQLPDIVRWHGDDFLVRIIDDATNFGPGFVHALAQRLDANVPLLTAPR